MVASISFSRGCGVSRLQVEKVPRKTGRMRTMEVCGAREHLTEAEQHRPCGENHEVHSSREAAMEGEHRVSVACVTPECCLLPSSQSHSFTAWPEAQNLQRKNAFEGESAAQKRLGCRAHMLSTYLLQPPCRGSSSETAPGWVLSAPGTCEEGSRELLSVLSPRQIPVWGATQVQLRSGLGLRMGTERKEPVAP